MKTNLKGTIELDVNDIEEAVRDFVAKKTSHKMTNWRVNITMRWDDYGERGPGIPVLTSITADIDFGEMQ